MKRGINVDDSNFRQGRQRIRAGNFFREGSDGLGFDASVCCLLEPDRSVANSGIEHPCNRLISIVDTKLEKRFSIWQSVRLAP